MRNISSEDIEDQVYKALEEINFVIDDSICNFLQKNFRQTSGKEKSAVEILLKNAEIAKTDRIPLCQDTGLVTVFAEIGCDVQLSEPLEDILNRAVEACYKDNYLRKSIVVDPIKDRTNTQTNTPIVLHTQIVQGSGLKIQLSAKGGGAENASAVAMLTPSDGKEGIVTFIINRIIEKGANCCPPLILGIGIGGNFERCAELAKKSLFRHVGERNSDKYYADLEEAIVKVANATMIGAAGLGGKLTVMDAFIETAPCHIASLPVALNISCHSTRHVTVEL